MQNITTIALSRLTAQQRALDVTAGNIANANTPGYRAERLVFSDFLSAKIVHTPVMMAAYPVSAINEESDAVVLHVKNKGTRRSRAENE